MKSIEVKGNLRKTVGKADAKSIRKNEEVPCVLYGKGENIHFKLTERSFKDLVFSPNSYLVNLDIEGAKYKAVLRDRQFHPISDRIIHADFYQIDEKSPIWVELPVVLEGVSTGVLKGGKLEQKVRKLKIKAMVNDLPDELKVNISALEIGKAIKVSDLSYNKMELIDPKNTVVVRVKSARGVQTAEEIAAETAAEAAADEKAAEAAEAKE